MSATKLLFVLFLATLFLACKPTAFEPIGDSASTASETSPSPTQPPESGEDTVNPVPSLGDCTNLGPLSEGDCLPTKLLREIQDDSTDYNYRNPNSDPTFPPHFDKNLYLAPQRLIDIEQVDPDLPISDFFKLSEFISTTKGPYGMFSRPALNQLVQIRAELQRPLIVTSAYRSPGYNSKIPGSANWSRHTYGDAADLVAPGVPLEELAQTCLDYGASYFQIYEHHVHCDWRAFERDGQFFQQSQRGLVHNQLSYSLEQQTKILMSPLGDNIELHALHPPSEDGFDLAYRWTVVFPDSSLQKFKGAKILLPNIKGTYKVNLIIGGAVEVNYRLSN